MPRHAQGLRVVTRPDTGALTIMGTVNGQRIRQSAKSSNRKLANQEAAALEVKLLEDLNLLVPEQQVRSKLRELAHAVAAVLAIDPSAREFFQAVLERSITRGDQTTVIRQ